MCKKCIDIYIYIRTIREGEWKSKDNDFFHCKISVSPRMSSFKISPFPPLISIVF